MTTTTETSPEMTPAESLLTRPASVDPLWAEKIQMAREAREQGRRLRADRPAGFSKSSNLHLT